ncbi:MAG: hypothetical protein Q9168_006890 [Polycauliona sp. 1 TL-2023]
MPPKVQLRALTAAIKPLDLQRILEAPQGISRRLRIVKLFESLKCVTLELCLLGIERDQLAAHKLLSECLFVAQGLEVLCLDINIQSYPLSGDKRPLGFSLSTRSLKHLQLRGMHVTLACLQSLLKGHYGTLESLEIESLHVRHIRPELHQHGLALLITTLAAHMHVQSIYAFTREDSDDWDGSAVTMNRNMDWQHEYKARDTDEFYQKIAEQDIKYPACTQIGLKAVRKETDGLST